MKNTQEQKITKEKKEKEFLNQRLFKGKLTYKCEIKLEPLFNLITDTKKWEGIDLQASESLGKIITNLSALPPE